MNKKQFSNSLWRTYYRWLYTALAVFVVLDGFCIWTFLTEKDKLFHEGLQNAEWIAQIATRNISKPINDFLKFGSELERKVKDIISIEGHSREELKALLRKSQEEQKFVFNSKVPLGPAKQVGMEKAIIYKGNAGLAGTGLRFASNGQTTDGPGIIYFGKGPSYTPPFSDMAGLPNVAGWRGPYESVNEKGIFTMWYDIPIRANGKVQVVATLTIGFPLNLISEYIDDLPLGKMGFAFLVGKSPSNILYHPNTNIMRDKTSLSGYISILEDNYERMQDYNLNKFISGSMKMGAGSTLVTNVKSYKVVTCNVTPDAGWGLVAVFDDLFIYRDKLPPKKQRREWILITLISVLLIFIGIEVFLSPVLGLISMYSGGDVNIRPIMSGYLLAGLVFFVGICFIWYIYGKYIEIDDPRETRLLSPAILNKYLNDLVERETHEERGFADMKIIYSGINIENIMLQTNMDILYSGFFWKNILNTNTDSKNTLKNEEEDEIGMIFPQILFTQSIEIEKAYETESVHTTPESSYRTVGWRFKIMLRENFDFTNYPFDYRTIQVRMWDENFGENVILAPDLEAYDNLDPHSRPGLSSNIFIPGWEIMQCYFSYRTYEYNNDFGIERYTEEYEHEYSELQYNIMIKRSFLPNLISQIIPLCVVAVLLYVTLHISSRKDKDGLLGFNVMATLGTTAALFFVLIVSHIDMRNDLPSSKILYLEYFYFLLYFSILFITLNALHFTLAGKKENIISKFDNLLPKLLFWPLLGGATFMITVCYFI